MKKVNLKAVLAAAAVLAVLTVGGIYAYLTFTQSVTNTFTVGSVSATLTEPGWDAAADEHSDIYPAKSFVKDPTITIGETSNDAVVFMEVTYPVQNVVTANSDGSKNAAADTQLFTPGTLGDGWTELSAKETTGEGTVTKVYGLNTELAAGEDSTLFEEVTFANVVEGEVSGSLDVVVKADAIQAGGMTKAGDTYTAEELGAIYDKFVAQNASN